MRNIVLTSLALQLTAGIAVADSTDMAVGASTSEGPGPGKIEAGVYMGGFISNYFHQFYDTSLTFPNGQRPLLETLSPEIGARFAYFFNKWVGVEGEGEVILTSTDTTGQSAQIYGLGAQVIAQYPMRFTPFVNAGFDLMHISSDMDVLGSATKWPIHVGGGARLFVTPSIAIRADIRLLRGPSEQAPYTLNASYGEFNVGVSFVPGGHGAATKHVEDPDPDHDGVIGAADLCPTEPGNGSPDGCPTHDKDGDGIPDDKDKCPEQAETINGYEDTDGCPDTIPDSDGDGINDVQDLCKDQPEDKDGFMDEDGCPDPDNDNDGILDAKDKCPNVAGPVENGGCPDTDADKDGVPDRLDNCPDEPGTAENHGCKAKQLVVITKDQLKILDQVHFATGTAKLAKTSDALLDNIARVMTAHMEIWKVKVEGYTDDVGKPDKNLKLSQDRAKAVVDYLVKHGVAPERLEAAGHGQDSPIGDNKSAAGREANRRVEFNIVPEQ
jgi:outer membrane protein OmpA-like peptidoglycan-associated protein